MRGILARAASFAAALAARRNGTRKLVHAISPAKVVRLLPTQVDWVQQNHGDVPVVAGAGRRPVHSEPAAEQIIPSAGGLACWEGREIAKNGRFWHFRLVARRQLKECRAEKMRGAQAD